MKRTTTILAFAIAALSCHAQDYGTILRSIEKNNPTLKALRAESEATKLGNMTGLSLDDPEVSYSYMFGSTADVPNQTNIEVTQSFDLATISGARRSVAKGQNRVADAQYRKEASGIMQEARAALINLAYGNQLSDIYSERQSQYRDVMAKTQKAFDNGEITIMSLNVMKLRMNALENDMRMAQVERDAALSQLTMLNGGTFGYTVSEFPGDELPLSFEALLETAQQRNPDLAALDAQTELSRKEISLARKESLPTFSAGYVNELVKGANYHGFQVGMSLPLWNNRGKVKAAKAAAEAAQLALDAERQKAAIELRSLYDRTASLGILAQQYRQVLDTADNTAFLDKALEKGEMSLFDYISEIDAFNDTRSKCLEAQRDYHLSLAELLRFKDSLQ